MNLTIECDWNKTIAAIVNYVLEFYNIETTEEQLLKLAEKLAKDDNLLKIINESINIKRS